LGCPVKLRSSGIVGPTGLLSRYGTTVSLARASFRRLRKMKRTTPRARSTTPDTTPPIIAPKLVLDVLLQQGELLRPDTLWVNAPRIRRRDIGSRSSGNFMHQ